MNFIPEISWPQRNTKWMVIEFPDVLTLYYSYNTLIGAVLAGEGTYLDERKFSRTTSRQIREEPQLARWGKPVSGERLQELVNHHMVLYFQEQLRDKFTDAQAPA